MPHGYTGDATEAIIAQIERFAPGFRDRIVARPSGRPRELAAYNPNYVGGDILTGANTPGSSSWAPLTLSPYPWHPRRLLCSAATPPGAGVHGMCGANAAAEALRYLRRRGKA